jgi:DNA polymerase-3 subunit alpha
MKPDEDLFDVLGDGEFSLQPKYEEAKPFTLEEKLLLEKQVLGLYLSDHPVSSYRKLFDHFGCMSIEEVTGKKEAKVLLGVYISAVKKIRTKKGEKMAFLTVNAEEGDLDAVVFPTSYLNFGEKIQTGAIVMIQGLLEDRDGKPQVNVQHMYSLAEAKQMASAEAGTLFIKIESDHQTKDVLKKNQKKSDTASWPYKSNAVLRT